MKKLNKKQKITLRKVIAIIRTFFLIVALISFAIAIASIDGGFVTAIILIVCGIIEILVSIGLDKLLFETAYSGDKKSPFIH